MEEFGDTHSGESGEEVTTDKSARLSERGLNGTITENCGGSLWHVKILIGGTRLGISTL